MTRLPAATAILTAAAMIGAMLVLAWPIGSAHSGGVANTTEENSWTALREATRGPAIVLFRHANAPGNGDPPGFKLGDCKTQRNLDEAGRAQARRIGEAFKARDIKIGLVLSSQWCRSAETAELAFPGQTQFEPAFNSFFDEPTREREQTDAARKRLLGWTGPGVLVVATHQVNITALTGISPGSGEGIVLQVMAGKLTTVGRIRP